VKIIFDEGAWDDFTLFWAIEDRKTFFKIVGLIESIKRDPFKGLGKPEPLKYSHKGYWSRRITEEHRLIYQVSKDEIRISSCKGHYE
jgi:toxin YoeB